MSAAVVAAVVAGLLVAVGLTGIVVPVLPGSLLVLSAMVVWSLTVRAPEGWWALGLGGTLSLVGLGASLVLTGRRLRRREIPQRSLLIGAVGAAVGLFTVPVVGLLLGFLVGLFAAEAVRQRDLRQALESSGAALRAAGWGMVVELVCGLSTGAVLSVCILVYFLTL